MNNEILFRILKLITVSFSITLVLTPIIKKIGFKIGATDKPRELHIHNKEIAKLGGVGIYLSILIGYLFLSPHNVQMNSILAGATIIIIFGIMDDIIELSPKTKLIGQFLAAFVVSYFGNVLLSKISAFGINLQLGIFTYPVTIIFIVACINCMNLIDGMDGLCGGISSIYFLTIGIIAVMQNKFGNDFVLTFLMLGATLAFLIYNFPPAKIFAGDSGSMLLGYIISVIALLGFKNVTLSSLIVPLLLIAIPILDTFFAILRRSLKGEKITQRDQYHIHHQLLNRNLSNLQALLIIYFVDILFAVASIVYVLHDRYVGYILYGILLAIVIVFVLNTDVVYEHKNKKI